MGAITDAVLGSHLPPRSPRDTAGLREQKLLEALTYGSQWPDQEHAGFHDAVRIIARLLGPVVDELALGARAQLDVDAEAGRRLARHAAPAVVAMPRISDRALAPGYRVERGAVRQDSPVWLEVLRLLELENVRELHVEVARGEVRYDAVVKS